MPVTLLDMLLLRHCFRATCRCSPYATDDDDAILYYFTLIIIFDARHFRLPVFAPFFKILFCAPLFFARHFRDACRAYYGHA